MNTIIALFIILLLSASVFFSMFFALWLIYLILKQQHKIVETCFSVSVFSIVSNEIIPNIRSEPEFIVVHNLTFKKFLLYVLYCMNEDYYDNLYNYLYNYKDMNKKLLKKFLNYSIEKSDGQINISVFDTQNEKENEKETEKHLDETFENLNKFLLQDGHKKIIETDYYNVYARKDDDSELCILQNKDTCVTLIELI